MTSESTENGQGIKIKRDSELLRVGAYDDTLAVNIGEGRPILATFPRRTFFGIAITDTVIRLEDYADTVRAGQFVAKQNAMQVDSGHIVGAVLNNERRNFTAWPSMQDMGIQTIMTSDLFDIAPPCPFRIVRLETGQWLENTFTQERPDEHFAELSIVLEGVAVQIERVAHSARAVAHIRGRGDFYSTLYGDIGDVYPMKGLHTTIATLMLKKSQISD